MEHALWNNMICSAEQIGEDYLTEKEVRLASGRGEIMCTDLDCKSPRVCYCHGEIKRPYFSHFDNLDCDYSKFDAENTQYMHNLRKKLFNVFKSKGYDVAEEVNMSRAFRFDVRQPVEFHWTGKFAAPNSDWVHLQRELTDFELIVMLEGELYIEDEWHQYHVTKGEYLLMEPTGRQCGTKNSLCSFYWLHFSCGTGACTAYDTENEPYSYEKGCISVLKQGKPDNIDRVIVLMKQLQDVSKRYMEYSSNAYLSTVILCELHNQLFYGHRLGKRSDKQLYNEICEFIMMKLDEGITVGDIAARFGYNEKYLTTFFKSCGELPLKAYITNCRMEHAKLLLAQSNLAISEIAYSLGYKSVQQFCNAFHKYENMTPGDYRSSFPQQRIFKK